jgi:hypothetical protein
MKINKVATKYPAMDFDFTPERRDGQISPPYSPFPVLPQSPEYSSNLRLENNKPMSSVLSVASDLQGVSRNFLDLKVE